MNRDHLWRVRSSEPNSTRPLPTYFAERSFWEGFDPTFATGIHHSIYDEALDGIHATHLATVKRVSLGADVNALAYDPRDHFDFGYISAGWQRITSRLATGNLGDFARAAHALTDFYAHSTYGEFGKREGGTLVPYDPRTPAFARTPTYGPESQHFHLSRFGRFPGNAMSATDAARRWRGRLISGQWWRWFTTYPDDLRDSRELASHRCLPDHDLIAVDTAERSDSHVAYDEAEYAIQFADRRAVAVSHLRSLWHAWRARHHR